MFESRKSHLDNLGGMSVPCPTKNQMFRLSLPLSHATRRLFVCSLLAGQRSRGASIYDIRKIFGYFDTPFCPNFMYCLSANVNVNANVCQCPPSVRTSYMEAPSYTSYHPRFLSFSYCSALTEIRARRIL